MAWNEYPAFLRELSGNRRAAEKEGVDSVSAYLERVRQICGEEEGLFVFRGEPGLYERPCIPGIFRSGILKENPLFERQLLDALRQQERFGGRGYLETAMEVQDGHVLSRLLSVTWNCLIALYFAAAPGVGEGEAALKEDGAVYVIRMASVFQPGGENIRESFRAAVGGGMEWQKGQELLGGNHKLVDGMGKTDRIAAQRGGFILFQGDKELPAASVCPVYILAGAREGILRELKILFGMGPASLFPGAAGLAQEIMEGGRRMDMKPFSCENEFMYAMDRLEGELRDCLKQAAECGVREPEKGWKCLARMERMAGEAYTGLLQLTALGAGEEQRQAAPAVMERYNQIVRELAGQAGEVSGMAGTLSVQEVGGLCRLKAERAMQQGKAGDKEERREAGHRQRKSPQPNDRVTLVRLGSRSVQVKNATEAMLETVRYVLDTCKPEENWLQAACGSWLSSDPGSYERQELYFRGTEKTVRSGDKTYWVGTGSNSQKKCRQIKELCGLAGVPEHTVCWYTDAESGPLFAW